MVVASHDTYSTSRWADQILLPQHFLGTVYPPTNYPRTHAHLPTVSTPHIITFLHLRHFQQSIPRRIEVVLDIQDDHQIVPARFMLITHLFLVSAVLLHLWKPNWHTLFSHQLSGSELAFTLRSCLIVFFSMVGDRSVSAYYSLVWEFWILWLQFRLMGTSPFIQDLQPPFSVSNSTSAILSLRILYQRLYMAASSCLFLQGH